MQNPETYYSGYVSLTDRCNLSCPGCTVGTDRMKASGIEPLTMSSVQVVDSIRFLFQQAQAGGYPTVKVKFAGGEPTENMEGLRAAQPILLDLREKTGINFTQRLLHNGYNLAKHARELATFPNLQVAVSLWGPDAATNARFRGLRINANQATSDFDYLKTGIRLFAGELGGQLNLQHTLSPFNADFFPNMVRAAWDPDAVNFLGQGWKNDPFTLSISLWRPPGRVLNIKECQKVWNGLRQGIDIIRELQQRGIHIPHLETCFDYLNFSHPSVRTCGSGYSYSSLAVNRRGELAVTRCHALNPSFDSSIGDVVDLKLPYLHKDLPAPATTIDSTLSDPRDSHPSLKWAHLHGGAGCPDQRRLPHKDMVLRDILQLPPEHQAFTESHETEIPLPATLLIYQPLFYTLLPIIAESDPEKIKSTFSLIFYHSVNAHHSTTPNYTAEELYQAWQQPQSSPSILREWAGRLSLEPSNSLINPWTAFESILISKLALANTATVPQP